MKPIIKYAGGKTSLLPFLTKKVEKIFPIGSEINVLIEPFFGGGAFTLELNNSYKVNKFVINDKNKELITTYLVVKNNFSKLKSDLSFLFKNYNNGDFDFKECLFYSIREKFNQELMKQDYDKNLIALCYIFLNKTCFNGLMRFNLKGEFNSPFGKYEFVNYDFINLEVFSEFLNSDKVIIFNSDFSIIEQEIEDNTLIYYDPPYRPISKTSNFTGYNKGGFNDEEQIRLSQFVNKLLTKKNCFQLVSNSYCKDNFFKNLYSNFNFIDVYSNRSINSNGEKRGKISEILISNF